MMAWLSSRAFARLGFAPAYGANFASAAAGAAAAAALYAAVRVTDPNRGPASHAAAALGAGLFAFSRNVWTNSIQSEVFALNNLFVANLLLLLARHARAVARRDVHRARRDAFLGALLCGVAMTNQHTFALVGAPVAVGVVVAADPSVFTNLADSPFSYSRPYSVSRRTRTWFSRPVEATEGRVHPGRGAPRTRRPGSPRT